MKDYSLELSYFRKRINAATSKTELSELTYKAFLSDDGALSGKPTLYNEVVRLAVEKEFELKAKEILPLYDHLYTLLHEDKIPESYEMIEAGEMWMRSNPEYLKILSREIGDMFTSDREVNALALALNLEPAS